MHPEAPTDYLGRLIYEIRGQRVMLDSDLAAIYGIPTFRFNEAVNAIANVSPKTSCSSLRVRNSPT